MPAIRHVIGLMLRALLLLGLTVPGSAAHAFATPANPPAQGAPRASATLLLRLDRLVSIALTVAGECTSLQPWLRQPVVSQHSLILASLEIAQ